MKQKSYLQGLRTNDPLFIQKNSIIQSQNNLSKLISENHDRMYSKIYFIISLILAIFVAVFAQSLNWAIILFLFDLLLIVLIIAAWKYYNRRIELGTIKKDIKKIFEKLGLRWEGF